MVFSFFKKKEVEPDIPPPKQPRIVQPRPPAAAPAPAQPVVAERTAPNDVAVEYKPPEPDRAPLEFNTIGPSTISGARIDVVESSDSLSPAVEQAAICYANDQVDDAIAILAEDIQQNSAAHGLDTWLMLFDLYQMRNRHADFDELALRFVVAFERSAPVWQEDAGKASKPAAGAAAAPAKAGGPYFMFQNQLTADAIEAQLDQLEKLALSGTPVRVDFSHVEQIESAAASAIVARWAKFKKKKARFQVAGGPALADFLKARIEVMRRVEEEAPYWLLLLEIFQLLGLQEDFENLAVDFAITFELSPPSWDMTAKTKTAAEVAAEEAKLRSERPVIEPVVDACCLRGQIVGGADAAFQPVLDYAASHGDVRIDFRQVPRIDFVSAGALMNVIVTLTAQSKTVTIVGANELIVALFRIMGIADVARIVRKK